MNTTTTAYTLAEAAVRLDRSVNTVARYVKDGRLAASKAPGRNGAVRIDASEVERIVAERAKLSALTLDTVQAARALDCWPRTVQRLIKAGVLDLVPTTDRALRVTAESVARYRALQRDRLARTRRRAA